MSRSLKKGPFVDQRLQEKVNKAKAEGNRKPIRTWARASSISPDMVGVTLSIHNGKSFQDVFVTESMVGHKVGEFALTRTWRGHSQKGKVAKSTGSTGRSVSD
ncbi:30S ribosomal protein S19 [Candidatus Dojkabacteria bacterium]|uniref:Small ribosomal subunit protein uS19 n=1 Tax=Candidatus Dojkabacteria bacterium TaxID=2099670 RepID=A0A955RKW4_9BACT|nr:30S ribosomal protein S19 [Candidatus Dojkabacteria bacterium]